MLTPKESQAAAVAVVAGCSPSSCCQLVPGGVPFNRSCRQDVRFVVELFSKQGINLTDIMKYSISHISNMLGMSVLASVAVGAEGDQSPIPDWLVLQRHCCQSA